MKKIFIISSVFLFAACNNSGDKAKVDSMSTDTTATAAAKTMPDINSPYPVVYSSKFEIGDPKNAETVLKLWKDWDNNSLMNSKDLFADTLTFYFSDGSMMHASRDSALAMAQKIRDSQASITSSIDAVMSAKSLMNNTSTKPEDQNENWALIWGEERVTDKKGKKDSSAVMETWRINKDGKVDMVFQYRKKLASPKK
jgi:hypothetical protein